MAAGDSGSAARDASAELSGSTPSLSLSMVAMSHQMWAMPLGIIFLLIRLRAAAAEGGSSGAPELRSSCQWKDTDTRGMGSDGLRGPELNTNQLVNI